MFKSLFNPIKIGSLELKNRFVVPAMGSGMSKGGNPTPMLIHYHAARARGGFGLNIIEVTLVKEIPGAVPTDALRLTDDSQIEAFKALIGAIHEAGGKAAVQLYHHGRQGSAFGPDGMPVPVPAPSPLPCPLMPAPVHVLSTEEAYDMIECFVAAALRAKKAGADAVEVHGAHGYIIAEFMSAYSNRRVDEFGGSFENRMRFPRMIIEGIKRTCGQDFPVLFRFGGDEKIMGGRTIEESRALARYLERFGVDAFHVTSGVYGSMPEIWGGYDHPLAYMSRYAAEVKKSVSVPVITAGRINDPYIAEELISSGKADMVALGRQSIADPEFPNKTLMGRVEDICPCIGCHQACTGGLFRGGHISCTCNPFVGLEEEWKLEAARESKKILVVGAGPAGLQAAWILAARGHSVTVMEKEAQPGGNFAVAALPPAKGDMAKAIRYQWHMGQKHGVQFVFRHEAQSGDMSGYDVILLCTGTKPFVPPIPGVDGANVHLAHDVLSGRAPLFRQRVLVAGGGMVGCETAEHLRAYGCQVSIVEMLPEIAADVNFITRLSMMERLTKEAEIHVGCRITEIMDDGVTVDCGGESKKLGGYQAVVLAMGGKPYVPLENAAKESGAAVYILGDAGTPANATAAIYGATELALTI